MSARGFDKPVEPPAEPFASSMDPCPLFPREVLEILQSPDEVTLMAVDPEIGEHDEEAEPDTSERFHGCRVLGSARIPYSGRRKAVGEALIAANRGGSGWSLCLDAHYALRLSRGEQTVDLLICFECRNVLAIGPGNHNLSYPIGRSAEWALQRELWRVGRGWFWDWRELFGV